MSDLPEPLIPAEVDLRDFQFMPLDVVRLRDSGLASDEPPETCWAAVLLWCAAWHQVPAGSIPNSDLWHAKQAGYVAGGRIHPAWKKVRDGALRNFVECSDGRLYHTTICQKAMESWIAKQAQRARTKAATEARQAKQRAALEQQRNDEPIDGRHVQRNETTRTQRNVVQGTVKGRDSKGTGNERDISSLRDSSPEGDQLALDDPTLAKPQPRRLPACPYEVVFAAYHEQLPDLPKVRLTDNAKRKAAIQKLWKWIFTSPKSDGLPRAATLDDGVKWVRGYFGHAAQNDFVMGRTGRGPGHENWRADFDFLLSDKGLKQVIEKTRAAS